MINASMLSASPSATRTITTSSTIERVTDFDRFRLGLVAAALPAMRLCPAAIHPPVPTADQLTGTDARRPTPESAIGSAGFSGQYDDARAAKR